MSEMTDDKLADLLRVAEAKAHVKFVSDPREHHNRAIAFDRAFDPPTAAALVRECRGLCDDETIYGHNLLGRIDAFLTTQEAAK